MKARLILAAVITTGGMLYATSALADCSYPKEPTSAPNGATATRDEMIASKVSLDAYQKEINVYLECLDNDANERILAAGEDKAMVTNIKQATAKMHNAAIDGLQKLADEFNTQLRAFKNKEKS